MHPNPDSQPARAAPRERLSDLVVKKAVPSPLQQPKQQPGQDSASIEIAAAGGGGVTMQLQTPACEVVAGRRLPPSSRRCCTALPHS